MGHFSDERNVSVKILVVSLQKKADGLLHFDHSLVDIRKETESSFRVVPSQAVNGRTYVRKSEIERLQVEMDEDNIYATIWALNESDDLEPDILRYWKRELKYELLRYLKQQNQLIKDTYREAIDL